MWTQQWLAACSVTNFSKDGKNPFMLQSDGVADFGERWIIEAGPTINKTIDKHHASADWMFYEPVQGTKSACDLIFDSINDIFGQ